MERSGQERRRLAPNTVRKTFGELSTAAIRARVRESNAYAAHWVTVPNLTWVRWVREDGRYVYCALRRRMDWLTGEIGTAPEPMGLDELKLVMTPAEASCDSCRIQMGTLLHGHDQWWSSGGSEKSLVERLDWIAQQMRLRIHSFLSATMLPPAA
jgi:hypothetical protein